MEILFGTRYSAKYYDIDFVIYDIIHSEKV